MTAYWTVISARYRMLLQYRAAAIAGVVTQLFWGFLRVMIFDAFYRSTTITQPMSFENVITYVWLGQALLALIPLRPDYEIRNMILKGNVAYELIRPLNLYWLWFSRELANRTAPTTLRSIPIFILSMLFFGLQPPTSLLSAFGFIISIILAIFLSSSISIIVNISLMWTISGEGVSQILPAIVWIFSGIIIPLPLFPDCVQPILNFLPFRGIMDTPFRLYIGHIPPDQLLSVVGHQLIWIVILIAFGRWILNRGLKRLVIQGG